MLIMRPMGLSRERKDRMEEKIYKTMRNTGAASIAVGIIVASVGLAAGIIAIVNGALLLKRKSDITF